MEAKLKGVFNRRKSWEKQQVFDLENGWRVTIEYNSHYGELVSRIEKGDVMWHCSNGLKDLPEFAQSWVEVIHVPSNMRAVRPKFERIF